MPATLREDINAEKLRPGAYVSLGRELYCVVCFERTGPRSGMLHVVNARDDHPVCLTDRETRACVLERRAL